MSSIEEKFSRDSIASREGKVRLVDSDPDNGLDLFCYNTCSNSEEEFVKKCRGLVFHGDTLVMKAFPYTNEYSHKDLENIEPILADFSKWSFYTSHEGALLRLFNFSGKWFLTTHRKLNAFRSKWASNNSFGSLFKRALENEAKHNVPFRETLKEGENILDKFQNSLDKNKQYMFLLCNDADNRIVCKPPSRHMLYHVGTFSGGVLSLESNLTIPFPEKLTYNNIDELLESIDRELDPMLFQGVICFGPDNKQVKILHDRYQQLFQVRGNESSIKFRYLQVRMNRKTREMLYFLYPNMINVFETYENSLYSVAKNIYNCYVARYINKEFIILPREEFSVMATCHAHYLEDHQNKISVEKVIEIMNTQTPTNLNRMIKRLQAEKRGVPAPEESTEVVEPTPLDLALE